MTTYNTFAEAKLANPEGTIYEFEGNFSLFKLIGSVEANPADHLMTLEEFLSAGNQVSQGDNMVWTEDDSVTIIESGHEDHWNETDKINGSWLVLSAACFGGASHPPESKAVEVNVKEIDFSKAKERGDTHYHLESGLFYKKEAGTWVVWHAEMKTYSACLNGGAWHNVFLKPIPRMRTEYVKDERSINEIAKAMIDGEVFYIHCAGWLEVKWHDCAFMCEGEKVLDIGGHETEWHKKSLTPIDERQEFIEAMCEAVPEFDRRTAPMWMGKLYDAGFRKPE